jgi:hypothetical protein
MNSVKFLAFSLWLVSVQRKYNFAELSKKKVFLLEKFVPDINYAFHFSLQLLFETFAASINI